MDIVSLSLKVHAVSVSHSQSQTSQAALRFCKAHAKINRKMGNSTPCKIVTAKNFDLKLCIYDILVLIGTVGAYFHIGEILPLCDFFV